MGSALKSGSGARPAVKARLIVSEEMIALAEAALSERLSKGQIKRLLAEKYGLKARTAENVLARARDRLLVRSGKDKAQHKADAFAFYDSVLRNPAATILDKLRAQERIDKLFGLEAPLRADVEIKSSRGFSIDDLGLDLETRKTILAAIRAKCEGQQQLTTEQTV